MTTRVSKMIGISEDLPVGIDKMVAERSAAAPAVGLVFHVGTFGVAREMMGSIYRSLKVL
jgi:hypothetical protein